MAFAIPLKARDHSRLPEATALPDAESHLVKLSLSFEERLEL
jgi:hypothetical protein